MKHRLLPPLLALAVMLPATAPAARSAVQAPDTSLGSYLGSLRDSTAAVFHTDSLGFDTTGVDSMGRVLSSRPPTEGDRREYDPRRRQSDNAPIFRFNRLEGLTPGGRLQLNGTERGPGAVTLEGAWSLGLHQSRYATGWTRGFGTRRESADFHVSAWRSTDDFDALQVEPDPGLRTGRLRPRPDLLHYRREGWRARAVYWNPTFAAEAVYRDEQAHTVDYFPASFKRYTFNGSAADRRADPRTVRALGASLGLGVVPSDGLLKLGVEHAGFGGAFRFNRVRFDAGRTFRLGTFGMLGLQGEWASADSGTPAQERWYAGGSSALQGYLPGSVEGRQLYLARAQAVVGYDILKTLRIPHPGFLMFSLALFAETGAAPALDPSHGLAPKRPAGGDWASDVGIGLWHGPGILDPEAYAKLSLATPVGPRSDHRLHVTLAFSHLLDWF